MSEYRLNGTIKSNKDLPGEIWKDIPGFEGRYFISNKGRVKSIRGKAKNVRITYGRDLGRPGRPYKAFRFGPAGNGYSAFIHRHVAEAFLGPIPKGKFVNHIDANKINNCVENLEYVTLAENNKHAARMGLFPRGEKSVTSVLNNKTVLAMRYFHDIEKMTVNAIGKKFGVPESTVDHVVKRRYWRHLP